MERSPGYLFNQLGGILKSKTLAKLEREGTVRDVDSRCLRLARP